MFRCLEILGMQVFRFMITFSLYMFRYHLCLTFIVLGLGIMFSFISPCISILSLLVLIILIVVFLNRYSLMSKYMSQSACLIILYQLNLQHVISLSLKLLNMVVDAY